MSYDAKKAAEVLSRIYGSAVGLLQDYRKRHRLFVHGGRGFGKTALVRSHLLEEKSLSPLGYTGKEKEANEKEVFLSGRNTRGALARLQTLAAEAGALRPAGRLLFDDFDLFVEHVIGGPDGMPVSSVPDGCDSIEALLERLILITTDIVERDGLVCITSTLSPSRLNEVLWQPAVSSSAARVLQAFSVLIAQFERVPLDPWLPGWRERLHVVVEWRLRNMVGADRTAEISRLLLDLTGGHPAFFVRGLGYLEEVIGDGSADVGSSARAVASLRGPLEDFLIRAEADAIQRLLLQLKTSSEPAERESFTLLQAMANERIEEGTESRVPVTRVRQRQVLVEQGLIFFDHGANRYRVPGSLLRELIQALQTFEPARFEPLDGGGGVLILEPYKMDPENRGALMIGTGSSARRIELSAGPWVVASCLTRETGRFWSTKDLAVGPLTTEAGVRSAVRRLQKTLRENGLERWLENRYNEGYRWASNVTVQAPAGI